MWRQWIDAPTLYLGPTLVAASVRGGSPVLLPRPLSAGSASASVQDALSHGLTGQLAEVAGRSLDGGRGKVRGLVVWVDESWARLWCSSWPEGLPAGPGLDRFVRADFERRFDEPAERFAFASLEPLPLRPFLCAALPVALRDQIQQVARARKVRVARILPFAAVEIRRALRIMPRRPFIAIASRGLHVQAFLIRHGRHVDAVALPRSLALEAPDLVRDVFLRRGHPSVWLDTVLSMQCERDVSVAAVLAGHAPVMQQLGVRGSVIDRMGAAVGGVPAALSPRAR